MASVAPQKEEKKAPAPAGTPVPAREEKKAVATPSLAEKYTFFPIRDHKAYKFYKDHAAAIWSPEEIDLSQDLKDFEKLKPEEKLFIEHVLAFFSGLDGIIMEVTAGEVSTDRDLTKEQKAFMAIKTYMEQVHSETYSLLIDGLIRDQKRKDELFSSLDSMPSVRALADWTMKWQLDEKVPKALRTIAGIITEGVLFSGAFAAIYWFKRNGVMPGLTFSNELISRDEGLHTLYGIYAASLLPKQDQKTVHAMFLEAMAVVEIFYRDALRTDLIGIDYASMMQYMRYIADDRLVLLGYAKLYNVEQPFDFMEMLLLTGKTNFFERRVGEYQKSTIRDGKNTGAAVTDPNLDADV